MRAPVSESNANARGSEANPGHTEFSRRNLVVLLVALVLVSSLAVFAELQRPSIDRFAVRPTWTSTTWWREPIEINAHLRKPAVHAALNAITFNADGKHGWIVGAGSTILRTTNAGLEWERVVWDPAAGGEPAKSAALPWEWVGTAHAQSTPSKERQSSVPSDGALKTKEGQRALDKKSESESVRPDSSESRPSVVQRPLLPSASDKDSTKDAASANQPFPAAAAEPAPQAAFPDSTPKGPRHRTHSKQHRRPRRQSRPQKRRHPLLPNRLLHLQSRTPLPLRQRRLPRRSRSLRKPHHHRGQRSTPCTSPRMGYAGGSSAAEERFSPPRTAGSNGNNESSTRR